ncbi:MAG: orotate phosphoribosyltransferase [Omnitrophica WOR_2 bacterium GWF2_43_52]|nr:MAG: orotate phosphoribosyltransferase [Omnitrophica WOR_2 bacterium GWC2_44_8]OGX22136.1 MAG: orotate phosphoribosyltransferase [Omnitrophica WOR_2 bacterium GWF2_43_52]HAH20609.1 orotate phosphoribosyltransferase [Candidatus Omnitrophota bacterium]HBG63527.1 orotate phosphoribosyltransferase [Candidatus Omnitrophota bacterium]HCD38429.1 orotate phosphoribosyltransferase [Candidatus Omnitrophota bacterium]
MNKKTEKLKKQLLALLKKEAFREGEIVLSSGKTSPFYIDGRCVTLNAEGAYLTAALMFDILKKEKFEAAGGLTLGADPIVGALAAVSFIKKKPFKTFIIRKTPKAHGRRRQIEGPSLKAGSRVILVDDVATSGKSFVESIEILRQEGFLVDTALCIVDRQEGAAGALAQKNCQLISLFTPQDLGINL